MLLHGPGEHEVLSKHGATARYGKRFWSEPDSRNMRSWVPTRVPAIACLADRLDLPRHGKLPATR